MKIRVRINGVTEDVYWHNPEDGPMPDDIRKGRIAYLEHQIEQAPSWGAAVGAMYEELRGLK